MLYDWLKALHVISVISWMAALLYLPRLFVYHCSAAKGGELSETLKIMERRLGRFIMNPAMIASLVTGAWLLYENPALLEMPYMHVKLTLLALLLVVHFMLMRWSAAFAMDANSRTHKFYRVINEIPTLLMIGIVVMVLVRP